MGSIDIYVEPGKVVTKKEFIQSFPPYSIGLDGIVKAKSFIERDGPYANFDHHIGGRIEQRSTSDQVHISLNIKLFDLFQKEKEPHANLWVNDCDEDVCLSTWLFKNHAIINAPKVITLVYFEDRLDTTAGSYPFDESKMRRQMAWIFEPYNIKRFRRELKQLDAAQMRDIIDQVHGRISAYVEGSQEEISLEGHYEILGGGPGWVLTKEKGPAARMAMFNNGIDAYIALVAEDPPKGIYHYVIGMRSQCVPFPIHRICKRLNEQETAIITQTNRYGASEIIGGSPRETGSGLHPRKLERIVNEVIEESL